MNDQTSNPALAFTRTQLESNLHWVSILLRLTIGSLFLGAALVKTPMGISGVVAYYSSLLHDSLLPGFLVRTHATVILFLEYGMALWLFSGFRLRFAGKYDVAANNYFYVFLGALGLLSSPFDRWVLPRTSNSAPRPS